MKIIDAAIPDVKIIEPTVFRDSRGFLLESFHQQKFESGIAQSVRFVQDNYSCSAEGVLRGLHYQLPPYAQGKLLSVVQGSIWDVAVDIRRSSPSFGKYVSMTLSADSHQQLWIPEGFAHGFITLTPTAHVLYKATNYYAPEYERCILWNDPSLGIEWTGTPSPILSDKDKAGRLLADAACFE